MYMFIDEPLPVNWNPLDPYDRMQSDWVNIWTMKDDEEKILHMVNRDRRRIGLAPLAISSYLQKTARDKAWDMHNRNYYAHYGPDGIGPPFNVGENIASGNPSPEAVYKAWFDSPGHRDNMMDPSHHFIGIGRSSRNLWAMHLQ